MSEQQGGIQKDVSTYSSDVSAGDRRESDGWGRRVRVTITLNLSPNPQ